MSNFLILYHSYFSEKFQEFLLQSLECRLLGHSTFRDDNQVKPRNKPIFVQPVTLSQSSLGAITKDMRAKSLFARYPNTIASARRSRRIKFHPGAFDSSSLLEQSRKLIL
jgi:hypothetical protein